MNRAHSLLTIKSFDDEQRIIEGIASTPTPDRTQDVVVPTGVTMSLPLPFLYQHNANQPIGHVIAAKVTEAGIAITAQIAKGVAPFIDEAWSLIKAGLVQGLSIGFRPTKDPKPIKGTYGVRFDDWELMEVSAVTIPANAEASIQLIKSLDREQRAERDPLPGSVRLGQLPADAGAKPSKGSTVKTYTEQIKDLEATRAAKAAERAAVMEKSMAEGRSTEEDEGEQFDTITRELAQIDKDLGRLRVLEAEMLSKAQPVQPQQTLAAPTILKRSRDAEEKFVGQNFTRKVIAKAAAYLDQRSPWSIAEERWGKTNPSLVEIIKANEVPGGGTGSGEWGAELAVSDSKYTGDFIQFLYGKTVFDKLPLRQVPANVFIKGQDGASTGYWVGESKPIPNTSADFSDVELRHLKLGAIAVISNELIRYSSPDAEMLVRDSLVQAIAQKVDTTFLSASAASANVSPAGILNGISAISSSGVTADAFRQDLFTLVNTFIAAKNTGGLYLVMQPSLAMAIGLLTNALGQPEFPSINADGGTVNGIPVVTGDNVGADDMILLKPSDIWRIGDMGIQVSVSREAMIEQSSAPTGATDTPVAASQVFTSMFQSESTAIKVVRPLNFQKRRTSAVAYVGTAEYGAAESP